MTTVRDICDYLDDVAPPALAEDWDNVGLLIGDRDAGVDRVVTCLTLTEDVAAEAVERSADLIIAHHPVLLRATKRVTSDSIEGRLLLTVMNAAIAVYSPHTRYDSATLGINAQLAEVLELADVRFLRPIDDSINHGAGRFGRLDIPVSLVDFLATVKHALNVDYLPYVGDRDVEVRQVAVACGSAAEFADDAFRQDCQVLVTGEARFHMCLHARSLGISLVLAGHYATERPAMERLSQMLAQQFSALDVTASAVEMDPVRWA